MPSVLQRKQLNTYLQPVAGLASLLRPPNGWVRPVREALGMTQAQLAGRLGVSRQAIQELERSEAEKRITLERLEALAGAMGCRLVYALIPEGGSLETLRRERAEYLVDNLLARTTHSMRLESQGPSREEIAHQREALIDEFLREDPTKLWR